MWGVVHGYAVPVYRWGGETAGERVSRLAAGPQS